MVSHEIIFKILPWDSLKQEIAPDDQNVKSLVIGLEDSIALKKVISINPDIDYMIYKKSFELQKVRLMSDWFLKLVYLLNFSTNLTKKNLFPVLT